jgi:hypothetical protein
MYTRSNRSSGTKLSGVTARARRRFVGAASAAGVIALALSIAGAPAEATPNAPGVCPITGCRGNPPPPKPPPPPPPTTVRASFTWSLPSLGGSVASPSATRTGTLALNACSSLGGTSGIHTYTWTARDVASGAVRTATTTTCQTFLDSRPLNGHWTVRLDITANSGATASQTQDLPFRDALIATLGDSAASGEGNPDRAKANGSFADPRCDLSSHAASQIAADQTATRLGAHATVTLWNLACSGASITYSGDGSGEGGLLNPYDGQNWAAKTSQCCHDPLPSQLSQLGSLLSASGRTLDSVVVMAGANDTGWADLLEQCYWLNKIGGGLLDCENLWGPRLRNNQKTLSGRFDQLGQQLTAIVPANKVYLTEYWDPTHDDRTSTQDPIAGKGFSWWCPRDVLAPNASDRKWGYENGVVPLNAAIQAAATTWNFHYVGGIAADFYRHGLCATNSWIVSPTESIGRQGNLFGSWHANLAGQQDIANRLLSSGAFSITLPTPGATTSGGTANGGSMIYGTGSGRCIDVTGGSTTDGARPQLYDCLNDAQQQWVYTGGQLRVYGSPAKCLDADSTAHGVNGTTIQIWDCNGGTNQQWSFAADGTIRSVAYGRCLDAIGAGTANGTLLQLYDCNGGSNQAWIGGPTPNGGAAIQGAGSARCLDVPGLAISPGTRPQLYDCNGGANQQWKLVSGQLQVYTDKCLDVTGNGTANGTPVQIWTCNGAPQQQWTVQSDGTIRSAPSERCLDAVGDGTVNGTTLQIWDCNRTSNQLWTHA